MSADVSIKFAAADPTAYAHMPAWALQAPVGRTNFDPIFGADYGQNGKKRGAVTSLAPSEMSLGQIVPFEILVSTGAKANTADGITVTVGWNTHTTSGAAFGYDPAYGVAGAFIDAADPAASENPAGTNASVTYTSTIVNAGTADEMIVGTFTITGLDANENVVLETWVALDQWTPSKLTGNVHSQVLGATSLTDGSAINVGKQTIPLQKLNQFLELPPD